MLAIVLKILSIIGIVILIVSVLLLLFLLLLLFFPITYQVRGSRDGDGFWLTAKVNWLFGLFRVRAGYPEPGRLSAKALWFTLYDMKIPPEKDRTSQKGQEEQKEAGASQASPPADESRPAQESLSPGEGAPPKDSSAAKGASDASAPEREEARDLVSHGEEGAPSDGNPGLSGKILQKFQKIKHTVCNIYDKIKAIWDNISYYLKLLQEENTKQLASHVLLRICSILKSIRPRRMTVQLLFGMAAPDTTGYLYGIYCILSAALGPGFEVTPDFEQKRLEAKFDIAGHIIIWVFVINGLKLLLDRKLHLFLKKIKAGRKRPEKVPA